MSEQSVSIQSLIPPYNGYGRGSSKGFFRDETAELNQISIPLDELDFEIDPEDAIGAAARMLDDIKPDWYSSVDLETLDMRDGKKCICGQNELNWGQVAFDFYASQGWKHPNVAVFSNPQWQELWEQEIRDRIGANGNVT